MPEGPCVVYDDDHYYMASVIAELIRKNGTPVTMATPEDVISSWGAYTYDRWRAQARLMEIGVELAVSQSLASFDGKNAVFSCTYTGHKTTIEAISLVLVTARKPNDTLYHELVKRQSEQPDSKLKSVKRIGDCEAPAIIASAVFSGHRYARELEEEVDLDNPLKHDRVFFEDA